MLNFEEIEDCFPEHGALCATDGRVTVSAQWVHDFAHKVAVKEREECANILGISRADALLMAGEMTSQEWRTVAAILKALQARMRSNVKLRGE